VAKKVISKEDKGIEAVKRRGWRKNLKDMNAVAAAAQQVEAAAHITWQMQLKVRAHIGPHLCIGESMLLVKQERIMGVAPPASSVSSVSS
jgi:hypothetical protein